MPRFVVERTFPDGLRIPVNDKGAQACMGVVATNLKEGVTWVHSYVSEDLKKTYCVYDAPGPDAIREVARRNNLPADRITSVSVLDPYFYRG
jgi:Nickel responsive protein SCO4226-like